MWGTGKDCSRCVFGRSGPRCENVDPPVRRPPIESLTAQEVADVQATLEWAATIAQPRYAELYYQHRMGANPGDLMDHSVLTGFHTQCTAHTVHLPPRCTADSVHRVWHRC